MLDAMNKFRALVNAALSSERQRVIHGGLASLLWLRRTRIDCAGWKISKPLPWVNFC